MDYSAYKDKICKIVFEVSDGNLLTFRYAEFKDGTDTSVAFIDSRSKKLVTYSNVKIKEVREE